MVLTGLTSCSAVFEDQERCEVHRAEGRRAAMDLGQEGIGDIRRLHGDLRVGAGQGYVGDHAEEPCFAPARNHIASHGQRLDLLVEVELDVQPGRERSAGDHAELVGALGHSAQRRALLAGGNQRSRTRRRR